MNLDQNCRRAKGNTALTGWNLRLWGCVGGLWDEGKWHDSREHGTGVHGFFLFSFFFFWRAVVSCVCACTIHFGADMDGLR